LLQGTKQWASLQWGPSGQYVLSENFALTEEWRQHLQERGIQGVPQFAAVVDDSAESRLAVYKVGVHSFLFGLLVAFLAFLVVLQV